MVIRNYFRLNRGKTHGYLCVIIEHKGTRVVKSAGEKIPARYWSESKAEVKGSYDGYSQPNAASKINAYLRKLRERYADAFLDMKLRDGHSNFHAKDILEKGDEVISDSIIPANIVSGLSEWMRTRSRAVHNVGTLATYESGLGHMRAFFGTKKWDFIGVNTLPDFHTFLASKKISDSSAGNYVGRLDAFLKFALMNRWIKGSAWQGYKVKKFAKEKIALTMEEVRDIYEVSPASINVDGFSHRIIEKVRDHYVFASHTGIRYGDLKKVTKDIIEVIEDGDEEVFMIRYFESQKTDTPTRVAMTSVARDIFLKYGERLCPPSTNTCNRVIKFIAKQAGIDGRITHTTRYKGERNEEHLGRSDKITFHTSVANFITHLIQSGTPVQQVARITGKTVQTIQTYYRPVNDDHILKAKNNIGQA